MNAKVSVLVIGVKAVICLFLYNLQDCTCEPSFKFHKNNTKMSLLVAQNIILIARFSL